jgi:hypothetical protein
LATGDVDDRIRILDAVATNGNLDPRPWLMWMAQDGQPEVRKKSISILASMLDTTIQRQLRLLHNRERDEGVAETIRQVLVSTAARDNPLLLR